MVAKPSTSANTQLTPREYVSLAAHCTLEVGGPARYLIPAQDEETVRRAVEWAEQGALPLRVLGGGSNLVVADGGVDGVVVKMELRGVDARERGGAVEIVAAAGEPWDDLVRCTVEQGWAGLECLSGIPGLVGATPIQNVGAYGQEVSDTVRAVRALDRDTGRVLTLSREECEFAYRTSLFKRRAPDRFVILEVTYRLTPGGRPAVRYAELERYLADHGVVSPSLADVRRAVLAIRGAKSMVLVPGDPNRRSCGSFFVNPILAPDELGRLCRRAGGDSEMPRWPLPGGRVKLSAAWLIERAGFHKGLREGAVGLSSRHTLAIVCHDGARAADVVAFARRLRTGVEQQLGLRLVAEPVLWGPLGLD